MVELVVVEHARRRAGVLCPEVGHGVRRPHRSRVLAVHLGPLLLLLQRRHERVKLQPHGVETVRRRGSRVPVGVGPGPHGAWRGVGVRGVRGQPPRHGEPREVRVREGRTNAAGPGEHGQLVLLVLGAVRRRAAVPDRRPVAGLTRLGGQSVLGLQVLLVLLMLLLLVLLVLLLLLLHHSFPLLLSPLLLPPLLFSPFSFLFTFSALGIQLPFFLSFSLLFPFSFSPLPFSLSFSIPFPFSFSVPFSFSFPLSAPFSLFNYTSFRLVSPGTIDSSHRVTRLSLEPAPGIMHSEWTERCHFPGTTWVPKGCKRCWSWEWWRVSTKGRNGIS